MIKTNIVLDKYLQQNNLKQSSSFRAASNIRTLLDQLDLRVEVVPESNLDMFSRLLRSLKNGELSAEEKRIVEEIVKK